MSGWMRFLSRGDGADKTRRRRRRGQALIVVVVALPLLIGMAALSVTLSTVYFAKAHLQNTVDAAALAGAQEMTPAGGGALNQQVLLSQIAENDPGAQDPCVANTAATCGLNMTLPANTVVATAVEQVPATFAGIFGLKDFTVRAVAVAQYRAGGAFDYAIFQGDTNPSNAMTFKSGSFSVMSTTGSGASIHSNDNISIASSGAGWQVEGACNASGTVSNGANCTQGFQQDAPILGMPIWTVQQLTSAPNTTVVGTCTNPVNNYSVSGSNFVGGNLVVFGSVTLSGNITATGSIVAIGGSITLNGNATVNPGNSGVGVVLAAMPAPSGCGGSSDPTVVFNGGNSVTGIVYAPAGQLTIDGGGNPIDVTGSIVAKDVTLNGHVSVMYSPQQQQAIPVYQVALIR